MIPKFDPNSGKIDQTPKSKDGSLIPKNASKTDALKGKIKEKLSEASTKLSQIKAKLKNSSAVKKLQEKADSILNKLPMFKKDSELKKTIFEDGPASTHEEEPVDPEALPSFDPSEKSLLEEPQENDELDTIIKELGKGTPEHKQAERKSDDPDWETLAEWEELSNKQETNKAQNEESSRPTRKPPSRDDVLRKQFGDQYKDMSRDDLQKRLGELDENRPHSNSEQFKNWSLEYSVVLAQWRNKLI